MSEYAVQGKSAVIISQQFLGKLLDEKKNNAIKTKIMMVKMMIMVMKMMLMIM